MLEGMAVKPSSRPALRGGPFTVADARRVGLRWDDLQTRIWTRLSRGQYAWTGLPQDALLQLRAIAQRVPASYAFSGSTAAWLLGLEVAWCDPIEVTIGREVPVRARAGVRLRRAELRESDVMCGEGSGRLPQCGPSVTWRAAGIRSNQSLRSTWPSEQAWSTCRTSRVMCKRTPGQKESRG